jgi:hypothetical protein
MAKQWRILAYCLLALMAVPFFVDWAWASSRLDQIVIETALDHPELVADGKDSVVLTIRITENGKPRAGDLVQSWLDIGSGLLVPQWVYTDQDGAAVINFTPNAMTQYAVQDRAVIHIKDVSIGRLIEVGKEHLVEIPLSAPQEPEEDKPGMSFGS